MISIVKNKIVADYNPNKGYALCQVNTEEEDIHGFYLVKSDFVEQFRKMIVPQFFKQTQYQYLEVYTKETFAIDIINIAVDYIV